MFINTKSRLYSNLIGQSNTVKVPSGKYPKCKATTHPHFKYCVSCGHQLRENPKFCPCGNKVSSGDNYCDACGRKT